MRSRDLLLLPDPKVPQHELAIIGCCLLTPEARTQILARVGEADLTAPRARVAFAAIREMQAQGEEINTTTLGLRLEKSGDYEAESFILDLTMDPPDPWQVESYIGALKDARLCRMLLDGARIIGHKASEGDISALGEAQGLLERIKGIVELGGGSELRRHLDIVMEDLKSRPIASVSGVRTGLPPLDMKIMGFRKGKLYVVAGRPGMGKSIMALNFARHAAFRERKVVAYFSLEMSGDELVRRVLAAEAGIDHEQIRQNNLNATERAGLRDLAAEIAGWDLHIFDDSRLSAAGMQRQLYALQQLYGVDLVIVDYLNLMGTEDAGSTREQEVARLSRDCKLVAREMDVPVVALAQLSRACEQRNDKRPMLSDLRESGSLEQDADAVIFIYRDAYYDIHSTDPEGAEIIVAKQRDGETGVVWCRFDGARMRFLP